MFNFICKIFGHKYNYYLLDGRNDKNIRICLRCGKGQEFKYPATFPSMPKTWINLVQRTKFGAK